MSAPRTLAAILASLLTASAAATQLPEYHIERIDRLCPAAADWPVCPARAQWPRG